MQIHTCSWFSFWRSAVDLLLALLLLCPAVLHIHGVPDQTRFMTRIGILALALPVVVTAVGEIPKAVVDGEQRLLYPPGDIDGHLQLLLDDPASAARIGWKGRERFVSRFSLEPSASLLADIYRALVL